MYYKDRAFISAILNTSGVGPGMGQCPASAVDVAGTVILPGTIGMPRCSLVCLISSLASTVIIAGTPNSMSL